MATKAGSGADIKRQPAIKSPASDLWRIDQQRTADHQHQQKIGGKAKQARHQRDLHKRNQQHTKRHKQLARYFFFKSLWLSIAHTTLRAWRLVLAFRNG